MTHQVTAKEGRVGRAQNSEHRSFRYATHNVVLGTYIYENVCVPEIQI